MSAYKENAQKMQVPFPIIPIISQENLKYWWVKLFFFEFSSYMWQQRINYGNLKGQSTGIHV